MTLTYRRHDGPPPAICSSDEYFQETLQQTTVGGNKTLVVSCEVLTPTGGVNEQDIVADLRQLTCKMPDCQCPYSIYDGYPTAVTSAAATRSAATSGSGDGGSPVGGCTVVTPTSAVTTAVLQPQRFVGHHPQQHHHLHHLHHHYAGGGHIYESPQFEHKLDCGGS